MAQSSRRGDQSRAGTVPALAGAFMLLLGAQMPALEVGLLGTVSLLDIGGGAAKVLMVAAVGVLGAVALGSRPGLRLCALAAWAALLWPLLQAGCERLFPPERDAIDELGDALGRALGDVVRQDILAVTGVRAGAFVLLAGAVLVGAGAFGRPRR